MNRDVTDKGDEEKRNLSLLFFAPLPPCAFALNGRVEDWKGGRLEGGKGGRLEGWKGGRLEGGKGGRVEDWKEGRLEGGKIGRVEAYLLCVFSALRPCFLAPLR